MKSFSAFLVTVTIVCLFNGVQVNCLECPAPVICPSSVTTICTTDGTTYKDFGNDCRLQQFNCQRQRLGLSIFEQTNEDKCSKSESEEEEEFLRDLDNADPSCFNRCPLIVQPLCGTNGTRKRVFVNQCELQLYNCVYKNVEKWEVIQFRQCRQH